MPAWLVLGTISESIRKNIRCAGSDLGSFMLFVDGCETLQRGASERAKNDSKLSILVRKKEGGDSFTDPNAESHGFVLAQDSYIVRRPKGGGSGDGTSHTPHE